MAALSAAFAVLVCGSRLSSLLSVALAVAAVFGAVVVVSLVLIAINIYGLNRVMRRHSTR